MRVITFGTFDLFHYGHLRLLQRARALGDELYVGVSTDKFSFSKKNSYPIYSQFERKKILEGLECVDKVFYENQMSLKPKYIKRHKADMLVMGHDWKGKFYDMPCKVVYLKRTKDISTTIIKELING
jgi:glycerol-3-phosphate cytidylyltransferase